MPEIHILSGKRQGYVLELSEGDAIDIGNRKSAKLSIRDPWISYNHARITTQAGRFVIEDQNSSNGTWVNQRRVARHELSPDDVIFLGKTKLRFVTEKPAAAAPATAPASDGTPWWDRVITQGEGAAAPPELRQLQQELEEERRMRQALERFLDLPAGATPGDAARAGELEREVRELRERLERAESAQRDASQDVEMVFAQRTERLRQDHMSKLVELEGRAAAAEAKVVDLERRLRESSESAKKEVARARERMQGEVEQLKQDLEAARKQAGDLAAGGDDALQSERERGDRLEQELEEWRGKAQAAAAKVEELERELEASGEGVVEAAEAEGLKAQLEAALAEASRWETEHGRVIQEIDEISMEQIEIEDELKSRIAALEKQLRELGAEPAASAPAKPAARDGDAASADSGAGAASDDSDAAAAAAADADDGDGDGDDGEAATDEEAAADDEAADDEAAADTSDDASSDASSADAAAAAEEVGAEASDSAKAGGAAAD